MTQFRAYWVTKDEDGVTCSLIERSTDELPEGDILIRVNYSSLNYKDALSAKGMPGVTKNYPHTPGIDAAGVVVASSSVDFSVDEEVIVIGFDLGMNTPGGYGQYIRVPASWVVKRPGNLSLRESMILGTAGFTAALSLEKLEQMGATSADGPVLVTGATGGVGSVAVALLSHCGYEVVACSGKKEEEYLKQLGAASVIDRTDLSAENARPMLSASWAHAIDTAGGEILSNVLKSLRYGGSVSACGLVASASFSATVLPFILRGINLLGIDSVELPIDAKRETWNRLAGDWKLSNLEMMCTETKLENIDQAIDRIFQGRMVGRALLVHESLI